MVIFLRTRPRPIYPERSVLETENMWYVMCLHLQVLTSVLQACFETKCSQGKEGKGKVDSCREICKACPPPLVFYLSPPHCSSPFDFKLSTALLPQSSSLCFCPPAPHSFSKSEQKSQEHTHHLLLKFSCSLVGSMDARFWWRRMCSNQSYRR